MTSRSFGDEKARLPHLVDGKGGVAGEVDDLRSDVENAFTDIEAEIDGISARKPVRLATAAALNACTAAGTGTGKTLTQNAAAVENIDGVAVVVGDRVLVKNQVAGKDNGVYTVTTVGTVAVQQVLTRATDFDDSATVKSGALFAVEEGTANADTLWMLTTNNPITLDTTALTFAEPVPVEHAALHITGAADEIDGDHLDIDFTPSNYAPSTTPAEASNVDHLTAHLAGIDNEMVGMAQSLGCSASAVISQAGVPVAAETITIGADVYVADTDFVIGAAEATMDNLITAINTTGTENVLATKLGATSFILNAADAPGGTIIGGDPSIVLANTLTNYTLETGAVNLNTLAGKAAGQQVMAATSLTVTAAIITNSPYYISFPFTPTTLQITILTAAGALKMAGTDTFVITANDVVVSFAGGGGDIAATDVIHIVAYA